MNAAIQRDRDAKKAKPRGLPGHAKSGRKPTGRAKVRVVLTVLPDIVAAIPGNKNEYGNRAIRELLKKDGLI